MMKAVEASQQIMCSHCEEMVHRYAARCPYCQHNLIAPASPMSLESVNSEGESRKTDAPNPDIHKKEAGKITQVSFQDPFQTVLAHEEEAGVSLLQGLLRPLISLVFLLSGTFFFFFGILVKLFSKNGLMVLEWSESSWPYFVFPSLVVVIAGLVFLSQLDSSDPISQK